MAPTRRVLPLWSLAKNPGLHVLISVSSDVTLDRVFALYVHTERCRWSSQYLLVADVDLKKAIDTGDAYIIKKCYHFSDKDYLPGLHLLSDT